MGYRTRNTVHEGILECDHPGCRARIEVGSLIFDARLSPRSRDLVQGWTTAKSVGEYAYRNQWATFCPDHNQDGMVRARHENEQEREAEREAAHHCRDWRELLAEDNDKPLRYFGWR